MSSFSVNPETEAAATVAGYGSRKESGSKKSSSSNEFLTGSCGDLGNVIRI